MARGATIAFRGAVPSHLADAAAAAPPAAKRRPRGAPPPPPAVFFPPVVLTNVDHSSAPTRRVSSFSVIFFSSNPSLNKPSSLPCLCSGCDALRIVWPRHRHPGCALRRRSCGFDERQRVRIDGGGVWARRGGRHRHPAVSRRRHGLLERVRQSVRARAVERAAVRVRNRSRGLAAQCVWYFQLHSCSRACLGHSPGTAGRGSPSAWRGCGRSCNRKRCTSSGRRRSRKTFELQVPLTLHTLISPHPSSFFPFRPPNFPFSSPLFTCLVYRCCSLSRPPP